MEDCILKPKICWMYIFFIFLFRYYLTAHCIDNISDYYYFIWLQYTYDSGMAYRGADADYKIIEDGWSWTSLQRTTWYFILFFIACSIIDWKRSCKHWYVFRGGLWWVTYKPKIKIVRLPQKIRPNL